MYKIDKIKINFKDRMNVFMALKKGNITIFGPSLLVDFENKLNKKLDVQYSCILPNCTSAIFAALNALGLKADDEVIIPNLTHSSSIYPLVLNNIKFSVYDFLKDSYNADVSMIEKLITKKTKAIMVCYLHGYPLNICEIKKLCNKYNLYLIEDAAQGFGIKENNKYAGTIGDYGCYSFGASKMLKIGEGGAIVSNNINISNSINKIRHVGEIWSCNGKNTVDNLPTYNDLLNKGLDYDGNAFNFRVLPFAFAYAKNKLKSIDCFIEKRQKKLLIYYKYLKNVSYIRFINNIEYGINNSAPFSAWLLLDDNVDMNKIIAACLRKKIPIGKFKYNVVNKMSYFNKYKIKNNLKYKNSKIIHDRSLFLPIYENLSYNDIKKISLEFIDIINLYKENSDDEIFNIDILEEKIKYFNGFFIM